jgi:Transposase DDE domain
MRNVLTTEHGRRVYRQRNETVEPLFGNTKHNNGVHRFLRRGRDKVRTEWRLPMTTHNLTKLHRHQLATMGT